MSVSESELQALIDGLKTVAAPTLVCIICGEWLDECHADVGTHPLCDPAPTVELPPPSTVAELRGVLIDFDANSARSRQTAIGPSEIGVPCDRRLAYRLREIPTHPDGRVPWAPMVGTAVHAMIAAALTEANTAEGKQRWLIEERVNPDESISGSCDCYDTDTDTVIDWKVVGPTRLDGYRRHGPGQQYETQIHLYGRGWQRAGRRPQHVRIVFLPRSTDFDDAYEWTAPYSRPVADLALDRVYELITLTRELEVDTHPEAWAKVPAQPDRLCRWCPYFRRGGEADATGCPGDVEADARAVSKFTDGLIAQ